MNKILEMKFGSHLHGTSTPESDIDLKAIYIPTAKQIVLNNYQKTIVQCRSKIEGERNTKDDIDTEILSLDRFLELLAQGQTMALDILFGFKETGKFNDAFGFNIMNTIYDNRDKLITCNISAFLGYARVQAHRYGVKGTRMDALKRAVGLIETLPIHDTIQEHKEKFEQLVKESDELVSLEKYRLIEIIMIPGPNKVDLMPHLHICGRKVPFMATIKFAKEVYGKVLKGYGDRATKASLAGGVDWKALGHSLRVNEEAKELLTTGKITFPRPERELLLDVKTGKIPKEKVFELIEQGVAELDSIYKQSTLRKEPDREWIDDFIYDIYSQAVKDES